MDKGLINGVLFLDFKKAFDTVDHCILLRKLEQYGIKGTAQKLFKSYLNNRKQVCVLNIKRKIRTKSNPMWGWFHKGLIWGHYYFLYTYINDLPNCLEHTQASMFADDTNLTCSGVSTAEIEYKLNSDLRNLSKWLEANKLTLNTKTRSYYRKESAASGIKGTPKGSKAACTIC